MNSELQSWLAGGIVVVTIAIFLLRTVKARRRGKGGSCGSQCGCSSGAGIKPSSLSNGSRK